MSAGRTPLGAGLYFIDVLACLLFCLVLALVGARFGREESVQLDLPELAASAQSGPALTEREVSLREGPDGEPAIWLDGEPVTLGELEARLRDAPPPALLVRSEASLLSRVVGVAHAAGVREIGLAYELRGDEAGKGDAR